MAKLMKFSDLPIDWDLTPEEAVTLYLEWGNNNWHGKHKPVRSKADYSVYFVVDTWGDKPKAVLIRRNSDGADELATLALPPDVAKSYLEETGNSRGVSAVSPSVQRWLCRELGHCDS
ncbi:MAG: DVU0772 family protein [Thermodesulfobacteriota bacterium]